MNVSELGIDVPNLFVLLVSFFLIFVFRLWEEKDEKALEKTEKSNFAVRWTVYLLLIFAVLIFGIYGSEYEASQFIYFQF